MIKHIKLNGYKGIETVELTNLGQINVICGKNNSGKSSILEAIAVRPYNGLGKEVNNELKDLFKPQTQGFSTPNPTQTQNWFNRVIDISVHKKDIWYDSDIKSISEKLRIALSQDPNLGRYSKSNIFKFDTILQNFFAPVIEDYKPFLIPPKRSIAFETAISTNDEIAPTGQGILNRLFFLKNQDLKSTDYEIYKSIYDEFEHITGRHFNIIPKKDNKIELKFNNQKNDWILAKDCGLGLSDVLIILGLINLQKFTTFLIEEPENHLHAEYQKKLLDFFKRQKTKQFILATHSNIFLDPNTVDKIIYTEFNDKVFVSDATSRSVIISALGYSISDNLSSDLIILTEGPTDVPIIREILRWYSLDLEYSIKYWPLGGDVMNKLDLEVLAQDHVVIALIDSDFQSKEIREDFKNNCEQLKIDCFQLERYAIENYLTLDAIKSVYPNQVPNEIVKLNHKRSLKSQLGFNIKSKNHLIIKKMTLKDIENTDLMRFCDEVKKKLKKNVT